MRRKSFHKQLQAEKSKQSHAQWKQIKKLQAIDGLSKFFKKCGKQNFQMGDDGQTFKQFLSMKGIQPNLQGTGRISFCEVKQIQCLFIRRNNKKYKSIITNKQFRNITELLSTYLNIPANLVPYELEVNDGRIIDKHRKLQYSIKRDKGRLDALQLLDLLAEYKSQSKLMIAFIQSDLHQQKEDIYGRACGDGVAIIDYNLMSGPLKQLEKFYETCIHESLHTLGFDHCLMWCCLMNPIVAEQLWLCPQCMKKIISELPQLQIRKWAESLSKLYSKYFPSKNKVIEKSQKIVDYFTQWQKKQQEQV